MSEQTIFDIVVIGGGPAGYCAAIRAAQLGFSVAVAEKRDTLGGTCLNVGCIPSKALLDSSERFALATKGLAVHGITAEKVTLDLGVMMARKDRIVGTLTKGVAELFRKNKISWLQGTARIIGPSEIEVDSHGSLTKIKATRALIIATGSMPSTLASLPIDSTNVVDSTGALSFDTVPSRLAVIGGGAIGIELASVWSRLGSKVTIIERMPQLLPGWDSQTVRLLTRVLAKQGIAILTDALVTGTGKSNGVLQLHIQAPAGNTDIVADKVLVAVGRVAYFDGLGLDKIGIAVDPANGRIPVNAQYMTACKGVHAIGDCIAGPMLAHKAFDEGVAVAEIIAGKAGFVNYKAIPGVAYTFPEVAFVGSTEEQLKEQEILYKAGSFPFKANGRALAMDSTEGYVKVLAHAETDAVLGVHVIGPNASDLIAEAVSVMEFGGSAEDIARTMHAHPTLSEVMREAALDIDKRSLHKL